MRHVLLVLLLCLVCVVPSASQGAKGKDARAAQLRKEIAATRAKLAAMEKELAVLEGPSTAGITQANYDRIEINMSLEEVQTLLGAPGKETSRANGFADMRWKSTGKPPVVIEVTFRVAPGFVSTVFRKRIVDD